MIWSRPLCIAKLRKGIYAFKGQVKKIKLYLIEIATSVHDLVLLPQVGKTFNYLQRQTLHNSTAKAQIIWYCQRSIRNLALVWRPEHEISGRGVKATHSNADFAKDLLWDLACFLQWLVQGATILWTTDGDKWRGFKIKNLWKTTHFIKNSLFPCRPGCKWRARNT